MGLRLESILIVMIVLLVSMSSMLKLSDSKKHKNTSNVELEFKNTTFVDVDKQKMQAKSFAVHGMREKGILSLKNLVYHTNNIEKLVADKGVYKENVLYLDGNVFLHEKEGFSYTTEHAKYNQKTEILEITSEFEAKMGKNIISGKLLHYDAVKQEANAQIINAIVYTVGK